MAEKFLYSITNWDLNFEKAQTRKSASRHTWVSMTNKHEGLGYLKIMEDDRGAEIFAVWIVLVQLASKCAIRGVLAQRDGEPYTVSDISLKTKMKTDVIEYAIPFLVSIKWVSHCTTTELPLHYHCATTAVATTVHNSTLQNKTKQNKTKQNKTAKNRPQAVDPSLSSSQSSSQLEENASKKYVDDRKFRANADAVKIWDSLPRKRRGTKRNFIAAILQLGDDHGIPLAEKFAAYYASEKGTGECPKGAGTLIEDEFWLDDPSDWGSNKKKKFTESAIDHEKIIARFIAAEKTNVEKVKAERLRGHNDGMIAYKICKKHPELNPDT